MPGSQVTLFALFSIGSTVHHLQLCSTVVLIELDTLPEYMLHASEMTFAGHDA